MKKTREVCSSLTRDVTSLTLALVLWIMAFLCLLLTVRIFQIEDRVREEPGEEPDEASA